MKKSKNNKYSDELKRRLNDVRSLFDVELNPDDPDLINQLTLGSNWDNPAEVSKALDMQPLWHARWAGMLKELKMEHKRLTAKYRVWESNKKIKLRELLIKKRKNKGATDKQAMSGITQAMVEDLFNIKYHSGIESYDNVNDPVLNIEKTIDQVQLVVDAFKERKDTLTTLGYLTKSMIENNLISIIDVQKRNAKRKKR